MIPTPPETTFDFLSLLPELETRGYIPDDALCVYNAGSLVQGWGNATSDADYYVITRDAWRGETNCTNPTLSGPQVSRSLAIYLGDRRVDIDYWTEGQVDRLIENVSWENYDKGKTVADLVTNHDFEVLQRMMHARALRGGEWLAARAEAVRKSAVRALAVTRNFYFADLFVEDAVGQVEGGDLRSAVLSARIAFGFAVDGLLSSISGFGGSSPANKWRARHLLEVEQDVIPYAEYWAIETMSGFTDENAAEWVERVVLVCRRICQEVVVA